MDRGNPQRKGGVRTQNHDAGKHHALLRLVTVQRCARNARCRKRQRAAPAPRTNRIATTSTLSPKLSAGPGNFEIVNV
eukprot:1450491-Lingulodinium_polyedra.AAC.1